jgi:SAM-dependent methyltransferase
VEPETQGEGRGGFRLTPEYEEINRRRMEWLVPNYLVRLIPEGARVLSIGCGTGYDVELLVGLGHDAYGFDRGERTAAWSSRPPSIRSRLRVGLAEDRPFGDATFDFGYALEVIEHVGCVDGGWEVLDTTFDVRVRFIESCVDMLREGGRLFLSTSNRLCPVDIGHMHRYSRLTESVGRLGVPLTLPWHPGNFVLSYGDIRRLVRRSRVACRVRVRTVSPGGYLAFSSRTRARWVRGAANAYMSVVGLPALRTSPANPLTTVMLERLSP